MSGGKEMVRGCKSPEDDSGLWLTEYRTGRQAAFSLKVRRHLFTGGGMLQRIDVFDTFEFGKVLTLDGMIMTSEKDEWMYHEMLVHVPLFTHPSPQRVLVVGGGDGGSLREVLRHPEVEEVLVVEIDEEVLKAAKRYLPELSVAMNDRRAKIIIEEGSAFVRKNPGQFDVIIVDSTDPTKGAGGLLFGREFYTSCKEALRPGGVLSAQTENTFYDLTWWKMATGSIASVFPITRVYWGSMPSYPSGTWTYTVASSELDPLKNFRKADARKMSSELRYYNELIHQACFVLPAYMERLAREVGCTPLVAENT